MNKQLRDWIWPALVAATIFFESSNRITVSPNVPGFDKYAHFFVYGLLATLLARVPRIARVPRLGVWTAVLLTSFYGATDEWHQSFTPGRSVEFADWLADTLGAALAVVCYTYWKTYRAVLEWSLLPSAARREAKEVPS